MQNRKNIRYSIHFLMYCAHEHANLHYTLTISVKSGTQLRLAELETHTINELLRFIIVSDSFRRLDALMVVTASENSS